MRQVLPAAGQGLVQHPAVSTITGVKWQTWQEGKNICTRVLSFPELFQHRFVCSFVFSFPNPALTQGLFSSTGVTLNSCTTSTLQQPPELFQIGRGALWSFLQWIFCSISCMYTLKSGLNDRVPLLKPYLLDRYWLKIFESFLLGYSSDYAFWVSDWWTVTFWWQDDKFDILGVQFTVQITAL